MPLLPVLADFRVTFINERVSPYFSLSGGYSFNMDNDFKKVGGLGNFAIGVSFRISSRSFINIGIDYEVQDRIPWYYYHRNYRTASSAGLTVGISF
jgi:hypothetical protein